MFGNVKHGRVNISSLRLLTGWWWGAIPTDGKTRQGWWGQAPQHVREKVRVGGHREAIEVGTRYWVAFARHDVRSWPSVTKLTLKGNHCNKSCESFWDPGWFNPPLSWCTSRYSPKKNSLSKNGSMLLSEPKCLLPLMSPRYNLVGLANVCFEGCYWGNKVKKGGSIKGDCRTFYPSFLCYCEISWKALFARGVGEVGTLTAIPYLRVKGMVPVGGKWQKKQVSSSTGDFDGHSLEQWRGCSWL